MAVGLSLCTSLIGPSVYFSNQTKSYGRFNRSAHVYFAVLTIVTATVSFILGLMKESFISWGIVEDFDKIIIVLTLLYTGAVFASIYYRSILKNQ